MKLHVEECVFGNGCHPVDTFQAALDKMHELWRRDMKAQYPDEPERDMPRLDYLQAYYCCFDEESERGCACAAMREALEPKPVPYPRRRGSLEKLIKSTEKPYPNKMAFDALRRGTAKRHK